MSKGKEDNTMISFIIPAYNAEATIERAVTSITTRMNNYELIVVENGSTDKTTEVAEKIAKDNKRIKVIHSEKGVSKARNKGIKYASGKWITFVDADDTWEATEKDLVNSIGDDSSIEMIVFSYYKNSRLIINDFQLIDKIIYKEKMGLLLKWMMSRSTTRMCVWGKIYKRVFLTENNLFFDETLRMSEDSELLLRITFKCNVAKVTNLPIYKIHVDMASATRSIDDSRINAYVKALEKARGDFGGSYDESFRDYVIAHINLICVHNIYNISEKRRWKDRNKQLIGLLSHKIIQEGISNLPISSIKDKHYIPSYCFSRGLYSIGGMICIIKSLTNRNSYRKAAIKDGRKNN